MKLYFAGPLFTAAERAWNAELAAALRANGHEVLLPQENEPGKVAPGIFATDVAVLDWADAVVAGHGRSGPGLGYGLGGRVRVREGADRAPADRFPGRGRHRWAVQPDAHHGGDGRLDLPFAAMDAVAASVLEALAKPRS